MVLTEQPIIDREAPRLRLDAEADRRDRGAAEQRAATSVAERAARESLRAQVAKLERELSGIVAGRFPHVAPGSDSNPAHRGSLHAARRSARVVLACSRWRSWSGCATGSWCGCGGLSARRAQRAELETRSRELLERMREEPGRYKFVRLPVTDLGERGCGVWEVRPRLGLLGMLAGWWQLTLSSGCPLPGPRARGARLSSGDGDAAPRARVESARPRVAAAPRRRAGATAPCPARPQPLICRARERRLLLAGRGERLTLAVGQRPHGLGFGDAAAGTSSLRQRLAPHLRWLISRSATVMLCASQGHSRITSAASSSPVAIRRLSSARASRTLLARSRARMY